MPVLTFATHGDACRRHPLSASLGAVLRAAQLMLARRRERQMLADLDANMLRDIGVTPYEAGVEASKPFWRP
ncbi:DUF1127 domain-containing protein [Teichococcus oryzae]|uniref:DUF1127 domain-containing protein n=1 Tax=Teichococcus oryzae TaxID=1608942 RepID=A0A5B2THT4_9PROT|nr:DUF1127 domain-containing protein [Pseudoroseomonas oryzae]KAA2213340.1 DUF1127 domain-containing protein [Pseudoroseomonas oryzae]